MSKPMATLNSFYNVPTTSLTIKDFSSTLPYRVIEALSVSNLKNLTARLTKSGWAWFVIGRKLFVWRYLDDVQTSNKPKASKCYELLLPTSDIAHKAELVCILNPIHQRQRFPSAIAVSPAGSIRYWSNIFQEDNFIDLTINAELHGQECQILIDIEPLGCILGTTTNSLVHIFIDYNDNEPNHQPIMCHTLKTPTGLFSGIGKKFSNLIFGSVPTTNYTETRQSLIRVIRNPVRNDHDEILPLYILVLFNCSIQKWIIEDYEYEQFCGVVDLEKHLKEMFINKFWNPSLTHHNQISICIMDITLNEIDEVLLLAMCNNSDVPNENHFALVTLSADVFLTDGSIVDPKSSPIKTLQYLRDIKLPNDFLPSNQDLLSSSFRQFNIISEVASNQQVCYIYNSSKLYRVNMNTNHNMIEEVDFQSSNDYLLGTVLYDQILLLLTFKHGFVSVHCNVNNSNQSKQLSASDQELVQMNISDKFSIIKRALNFYVNGEKSRAIQLFHAVFPFIAKKDKPTCSTIELDETVCAVSADICDHIPHADPRWSSFIEAENSTQRNDSTKFGSVIITNQLEEKLSTHNSFIELLKETNAWDSLTSLTTFKSILPTKLILCEHTEKLLVCLELRQLQPKFGNIIDNVIKKVLERRKSDNKTMENSHLTNQDLFYRKVTKVDDLFWEMIEMEENQFNLDQSSADQNLIISITNIMITVFAEVCLYRQANGDIYQTAVVADCDYVPWSSEQHVSGVRETLLKQFDLLVRFFKINANMHIGHDEERWTYVGQMLSDLIDIILDNFICQLNHLNKQNEKYATLRRAFEVTRYKCLETLLQIKQYEKAAALAEKYEDFEVLIKLCEELDNQDQLQQYSQRFADKGFSEHLFEWYLKEGKQGKMLSSSVSNNGKLDEFLTNHDSLKWLHQLHMRKFKDASFTLKKLSLIEENCPERKKTMLSIGKLALIASGDLNYTDFDDQIRFINYQFDLSDALLQKNNLTRKTMKVLSANDLVDILISSAEGPNENMRNFHKALEIAELVEKRYSIELHRQIQLKIWKQAFQKDDWNNYITDSLEFAIKRSFMYQLAMSYYGDETKKLPPLESLMEDYEFVQNNQKTDYFLRAIYEMINNH